MEQYLKGMSIIHAFPDIRILPELSKSAKQRLKWMDHYRISNNAALTCRYFGISRKTFYQWLNRYDSNNLKTLEDHSKRPKHVREWQVALEEERRIVSLRKKYIRYGKEKLKVIYENLYHQAISSWKVQRVIEKHCLYYNPIKNTKLQVKRKRNEPKRRITELQKQPRQGFLVALDTIEIHHNGLRRYILTGIDVYSKIAFARMYQGHGSIYAADFLKRMHYLLEAKIENIQTDNGSEFARYFRLAAQSLNLDHYFSRPRTPKDNAFDERFNRTLQDEFISLGYMTSDCDIFNKELTEWLVEYNFHRPHQSLGYETPISFHYKYHKVLPMYPSSTTT
jgi:transposase InsO family protein/transposase-like protein